MLNQVKIDSLQAFRTFCTILLNYLLRRCNKKICCSFLRFDCTRLSWSRRDARVQMKSPPTVRVSQVMNLMHDDSHLEIAEAI